ncbi:MAG: hypothetical protein BHW60_05715, partial [Sutterella sp. 54_7]
MNKLIIPGALALLLAGAAAAASGLDAPPPYGGDAEAVQAEPPARKLPQKGAQEDMSIAPPQADMEKARRDREAGQIPPKNNDKRTKIEAVRDPNNHVTECVVTPG